MPADIEFLHGVWTVTTFDWLRFGWTLCLCIHQPDCLLWWTRDWSPWFCSSPTQLVCQINSCKSLCYKVGNCAKKMLFGWFVRNWHWWLPTGDVLRDGNSRKSSRTRQIVSDTMAVHQGPLHWYLDMTLKSCNAGTVVSNKCSDWFGCTCKCTNSHAEEMQDGILFWWQLWCTAHSLNDSERWRFGRRKQDGWS